MFTRSGGVEGDFIRDFEPLSRQPAQLISEFKRRRIGLSTGALIPPAQPGAHLRRQQVLNYLVNSGGMGTFKHLKHIVRGDQRPHLAQVLRGIARLTQALVIMLLQLSVSKGRLHIALVLLSVEQGTENDDGRFLRPWHGIRLGGRDQGAHVRGHQPQVGVLRKEFIELFFQRGRRRLARRQLMKNDLKNLYLHGPGINSLRSG